MTFLVGRDPNGWGGTDEVSPEQAHAYAEAAVAELRAAFPGAEVEMGAPLPVTALPPAEQRLYAWLQRNWLRIRGDVNRRRGWPEQQGGTDEPALDRCL